MRVRGLKQLDHVGDLMLDLVAPRAGAWIETFLLLRKLESHSRSHPVRVRGLKQNHKTLQNRWDSRRTPCGCVD